MEFQIQPMKDNPALKWKWILTEMELMMMLMRLITLL